MNILDLLFPRRCVSCGRIGKYICVRCSSIIQIIELNQQVCPVCERPAVNGVTHPKCQTAYSLDGLTSFFVYDGPIKKAIKKLKYKFVRDLVSELISLAFLKGSTLYKVEPWQETILTPVPLHWRRMAWRGFNQSEVLGKLIAQKLNIQFVSDLLIRKKYTQPQVKLKGKERKENIQGAFIINPHYPKLAISHWELIIFDDVWTTGATLKTCGKVLKEAGAKKVWGMTLAR